MNIAKRVMVCAAVCALGWMATPSEAAAQDLPEDKVKVSPLEAGGPIVRRKLLYRSTRLEVMPYFGGTITDTFTQNMFVGANAAFHLTNEVSIGLNGGFGFLHPATSLRTSTEQTVRNPEDLTYSQIDWLVDLEGQWVPIFGKFSLMDGIILNYDIHLIGGVGFVGQSAVASVEGTEPRFPSVATSTVAGVAGAGLRLFVSDMFTVTFDVRDYIFARAEVSTGTESLRTANNVMMSLGVSIFLPGQVKVSR